MSKFVSFDESVKINYINNDLNEDINNDTDYEEEDMNPIDILKNLMKKKSFGVEEFGQDYESNIELRRKAETSFCNMNQKINKKYEEKDEAKNKVINEEKHTKSSIALLNDELNDIPKILGNEKNKENQPCEKCSEIIKVNYNSCQVCMRETVDVRCLNCYPNILELCSNKCREIYNGEICLIEITNDNDEPIVVIEDDTQNMVLSVINHKLFYDELSEKDRIMINKPCLNCNEEKENNDDDENEDDIKKIGVIPVKCCKCQSNYSYLIVCGICYQKSGIQYLCDECGI
jgi:hypothetical protein